MKYNNEKEEVSKLQEPAIAYGNGRLGTLRHEIAVAIGRVDNEAILEECLKVIRQGDAECELDRALKEAREGDVVSFDNVGDVMDFLNA